MVTLYRAANANGYFGQGSCWTENKNDAAAYMDNPGFGGPVLYRAKVSVDCVLDLTDDWNPFRTLAEVVAEATGQYWYDLASEWRSNYDYIYQVWEGDSKMVAILAERFDWIRYLDDYPYACTTLAYLGMEPIPAKAISRLYKGSRRSRFWRGPVRIVTTARRIAYER